MGTVNSLLNEVVRYKMYLWTPKSFYFPKVNDSYILGEKNRVIVINPQKIVEKLEEAKKVIEDGEKNGKTILLVCDKTVLKDEIERISHKKGMMYLNKKVPSGFFTNFNTFSKRIHSMNKLRKFIESSEFEKLTKKEQLMKKRELKKLEDIYKGVKNLNKLPDLVVVFDAQYYLNVIDELEKVWIDYIAFSNTDLSRWIKTNYKVVINTNSYESLNYALTYLFN